MDVRAALETNCEAIRALSAKKAAVNVRVFAGFDRVEAGYGCSGR